jgi:hypothetical protein
MGGTFSIAGIGQSVSATQTAGEYTGAVDLDDSGRVDVAVDVSGAATLTVEFSATGDFTGEEFTVTVDYDAATEIIEQFDPAHKYVRAQVDANLTNLEVVSRGV